MPTEVTIIFVLIYLLTLLSSASEMIPMSVAALVGALFTIWFGLQYGIFTFDEAFAFVDFRIIGLVIGTMIVVEIAERSGLFRFIALKAIKVTGGNPKRLFAALCITAALASMFLSDPAALLLMAAATTTIAKLLGYDPIPYLISAVIMVNLGGTGTLIGSVSNMIIGVQSGLSFSEFTSYVVLCELALWGLTTVLLYVIFKKRLGEQKDLPSYDPWEGVKDRRLFYRSALILVLLLTFFVLLDMLNVGPEAIALGCAIIALAFSGLDPAEVFGHLDWETIFFLSGFVVIVGGLEKTGSLNLLSQQIFNLAGESSLIATVLMLWFSGLTSAIVSNIAVALTFTPIIKGLSTFNSPALWSALILGSNLGGATTPMSGTVTVMAMGTLKREGRELSFKEFTKIGVITSLVQLGFSTLYLIGRFGLVV